MLRFWSFNCCAVPMQICIICCAIFHGASAFGFHWRSLQLGNGYQCLTEINPDLNEHITDTLLDLMLFEANGRSTTTGISKTTPEVCESDSRMLEMVLNNTRVATAVPVVSSTSSVHQVSRAQKYKNQLTNGLQPLSGVVAAPSLVNYRTEPQARGQFSASAGDLLLTAAPSLYELTDTLMSIISNQSWSYMAVISDSGDEGSSLIASELQRVTETERRICFPLKLIASIENVTTVVRELRKFTYETKRMPRLTVVFAGRANLFLKVWDLVTGTNDVYADTEKRLQFLVVGDSIGAYPHIVNDSRRHNFARGTIFVFAGILDHNSTLDRTLIHAVRCLMQNSSCASSYWPLRDTITRLMELNQTTDSMCQWATTSFRCFEQSLNYDFAALGLAAGFSNSKPALNDLSSYRIMRNQEFSILAESKNDLLLPFLESNFTKFSFARGLFHVVKGYEQPIIKVYQTQLISTSTHELVKVGETRVRNMGSSSQSYQRDLHQLKFYNFQSDVVSDSSSQCTSTCSECIDTSKDFYEFLEGDIYIGALVPVRHQRSDQYSCSDGVFRQKNLGGYEFAVAFKFIIEWANLISQGVSEYPAGFNETKMDPNFILAMKFLIQQLHSRSTQKLRWGYLIIDTCYSSPYMLKHLSAALTGKMQLPNFNSTSVIGFVGALSSTLTESASQLLRWYNLPLISYGSTSIELTDFAQYPLVLRTVSSDSQIVEAMVGALKHLGVDYVAVAYQQSNYGRSLWSEMTRIATREKICVARNYTNDCSSQECYRNLIKNLRMSNVRYVAYLGDQDSFVLLLSFPEIETEIGQLTFFVTEAVGSSDAPFVGRRNAGVGTVSVKLNAASSPGFAAYQLHLMQQMPSNPNAMPRGLQLHFENVNECYLKGSFRRNTLYTVPCTSDLISRRSYSIVESRSPFVVSATQTLVLGGLMAIRYRCTVPTPNPVCAEFYSSDFNSLQQRANLVIYNKVSATAQDEPQQFRGIYNGKEWDFQKIFNDRMGRSNLQILQYRQLRSSEYGFVEIGMFNGTGSEFNSPAEELFTHERPSASVGCRKRAACLVGSCSELRSASGANAAAAGGSSLLGLLALLALPAAAAGIVGGWFAFRRCDNAGAAATGNAYAGNAYAGNAYAGNAATGNNNLDGDYIQGRPSRQFSHYDTITQPSTAELDPAEIMDSSAGSGPQPKPRNTLAAAAKVGENNASAENGISFDMVQVA